MILVEAANENDNLMIWVQGSKNFGTFKNLAKYNSNDAKIIRWIGPRANFLIDLNGKLAGKNVLTYITPYQAHHKSVTECTHMTDPTYDIYDDSVLCTGITLVGVLFRNLIPIDNFKSV